MPEEARLEPGWLIKDVRKASDRVNEWAGSKLRPSGQSKKGEEHKTSQSRAQNPESKGTRSYRAS